MDSASGSDLQEKVLQRAIEKNAMESRGEVSPAVRSVGAPIEVAEGIVAKDRAAPEGYAYLAPADDMTKARLRADEERKPVSEERSHGVDWLGSPGAVYEVARLAEEAQRDWAFGWVQLSGYTRLPDVASQLAEKQVEVLGSSGNLIRARLPADVRMLNEIGDLPGIAGLGVLPGERKILDEELSTNAAQYSMRDRVPVFITLMSDDEDGRWRVALEERGAEVGGFDRATRAYSANVFYGDVGVIAAADFVLSIEQERLVEPLLASAVPVMGADGVRMYSGERGVFGGVAGASVAVGVLDTGLNIHHTDIATHRSSVCGANLASYVQGVGDADLWYDFGIHGTHVTGILAGNGYTEAQHAGVAPGVRHIRFGKVFLGGGATLVDLIEGVDYMAEATSCMQNGRESAAVKPLVVNMSLGTLFASVAQGRGILERKLDSAVWNAHQLYTISAGNSGGLGINVLSTAKNALSVGASIDDETIANYSSHGRGPYSSAHGRLKPNVTTVGTFVHSPLGRGSKDQYIALSGTSMSSPAMAGMAALMMDAAPDLRNQPATMRAYLMASAVRPDVWLDNPAWFPLNNTDGIGVIQEEYGMGSVSARVGVLNRDSEDGWTTGHASVVLTDGEYGYVDVTVPEGVERLDVVMTWDEPPAESVSGVVLNDLDLWVDERADCEDAACGEHSSASVTDNVEWVIIRNPVAGVYRVKAVGESVYTDEARVGMAWQIIRGPAAPEISLAVDKAVLEGGGGHELVVTLTVDGYVAKGVDLHVNCRASDGRSVCNGLDYDAADPRPSPPWYRHALVSREDGTLVSGSGRTIYLGELAAGEAQEVKLYFAYEGDDDNARITLTASAWNASSGGTASVLLRRAGSDAPMVPELEIPSNDSFLTAKVLEDQSGSEPFNLSLATSEAGESELMMDPAQFYYDPRRPRGSVWYVWTPSETQHTVLRVDRPSGLENAPRTGLVAFQGTGDGTTPSLANLREIARSGDGSVSLKASARKTYYLRVADRGSSVPLTLTWDGLERPANDGWRQATVLEGQDGSVAGDNKGATLEYGEWPWGVTATVWYRWTAPSGGAWSFDAVRRSNPEKQTGHHVFVYTGEDVSSLRIVSDFRNIENASRFPAVVQAARGRTYRIAVGSPLPEFGIDPGAFDLTWEGVDLEDLEDRSGVTNDNHGDAVSLDEGMTGSQVIHRDFEAPPPILTVEPDEPAEAGVFTRWYRWTAPETRRFTWLIQDPRFTGASHYRVAIFEGDSLDDLDFVGSTATSSETDDLMEFVVPMEKDQHYMISVGFPPRDIEVIPGQGFGRYRDVLRWGPTPENDDFDDAIALNGAQGNVTFGTHWSTRDAGEQVTSSGAFSTSDSIWYTYEADKSGWYEFYIPDIEQRFVGLGVYQAVGDGGLHSLQKVVLSHSDLSLIQQRTYVKFYAEAGAQYILRIAHGFNGHPVGGNEYQLRWRETEAPVWIKYLGYVPNSGMDMQGFPVSFSEIFDMSFNTRGDALYVASEHAMIVYKRDVKTGGLTPAASHDLDSRRHFLGWDAYRTRLLSYCTEWREMAPEDYANLRLKEGRRYAAGEEKENCSGTVDVLVDASRPDGQLLHRVHRSGVDSFSIQEATGNLSHLESLVSEDLELVDVALSPQSGYLYGANLDSLVIFEKDPETSELTLIETDYDVDHLHALSISDDGRYLFALERRNWPHAAKVFDLSAPSEPALVGEFVDGNNAVAGFRTCKVSDFRNGRYAVEFFCDQTYFAMEYRPGADNTAGVIRLTDVGVSGWRTRYDNLPPLGAVAKVLEASPDGGHLYMAPSDAARPGIHVFERVGNTIEVPEEVDETTRFRLDLLEVGFDTVQFGAFHASGGDCVSFRKATFEDVSYSIVRSRWQERRNANAPWVDIAGTEAEKKLCSYRPGGSAEYRLATEITVDSVTGRYASNTLDL